MPFAQKEQQEVKPHLKMIPTLVKPRKLDSVPSFRIKTLGTDRMDQEQELAGYDSSRVEQAKQKYDDLISTAVDALYSMGVKPENEPQFFEAMWSIIYSNLELTLGQSSSLVKSVETGKWDCDMLSHLVCDAGKKFGVKGMGIVLVTGHAFAKSDNYYFETTSLETPAFFRLEEMYTDYGHLLKVGVSDSDIRDFNRAVIASELDDKVGAKKAESVLIKLLKKHPKDIFFLCTLARIKLNKKSPSERKKGLQLLARAKKYAPETTLVYHELAHYYFKTGKYQRAAQSFEKALEFLPARKVYDDFRSDYYEMIGSCYEELKDYDLAYSNYERARDIAIGSERRKEIEETHLKRFE